MADELERIWKEMALSKHFSERKIHKENAFRLADVWAENRTEHVLKAGVDQPVR
jgi:hypothetical protein